MKHVFFFLGIVFMVSNAIAAPFKLMIYGDSLCSGYHLPVSDSFYMQLQDALNEKGYNVTVLHNSRAGKTTAGGVNRLSTVLDKKPDGVLLELGINDAFQNVNINKSRDNLNKIIETLQHENIPVLLAGMWAPLDKTSSYRQAFEKMYTDAAHTYSLIFYPFFMDGIFKEPVLPLVSDKVLKDGIHPNKQGIALIVQNILPTIEQFLNAHNK